MQETVDDFEAYVNVAWPKLLRSAWVLTGDWHKAEDLLQTVLIRVHGRWSRIETPDAYVRTALANTYLTWWRRRWRDELPTAELPEVSASDGSGSVELQHVVRSALATLPRQQRAVLMLRYHADFTELATADALGIGLGTVKSYTSRALTTLRQNPSLQALFAEEVAK